MDAVMWIIFTLGAALVAALANFIGFQAGIRYAEEQYAKPTPKHTPVSHDMKKFRLWLENSRRI